MPARRRAVCSTAVVSFEVDDRDNYGQALRLEYGTLRDQIAEADRTCVVLQGALITATLALVSLSIERDAPGVAWLITPLWIIGHCLLAEKRSIIVHTARYLRTEIESRHRGLQWETWHHDQVGAADTPSPVRYYPFYLEVAIATTSVLGDVALVYYLQEGLFDEPWFVLVCVGAAVFAAVAVRSVVKYARFEAYLAQL